MYRKFIQIFPSDILSITFFRLLVTIKRYYNNRWSFWPRGGRIPTPVICRVPPGFLGSNFDQVITPGRGGDLTKVLCGEIPPWGPIPDPFIYHFWKKRTPFVYRLLTNVTPFPKKVWTPFICCKCIVFKTWTNHKTRKLYGLFYIHKTHLSAL